MTLGLLVLQGRTENLGHLSPLSQGALQHWLPGMFSSVVVFAGFLVKALVHLQVSLVRPGSRGNCHELDEQAHLARSPPQWSTRGRRQVFFDWGLQEMLRVVRTFSLVLQSSLTSSSSPWTLSGGVAQYSG